MKLISNKTTRRKTKSDLIRIFQQDKKPKFQYLNTIVMEDFVGFCSDSNKIRFFSVNNNLLKRLPRGFNYWLVGFKKNQ